MKRLIIKALFLLFMAGMPLYSEDEKDDYYISPGLSVSYLDIDKKYVNHGFELSIFRYFKKYDSYAGVYTDHVMHGSGSVKRLSFGPEFGINFYKNMFVGIDAGYYRYYGTKMIEYTSGSVFRLFIHHQILPIIPYYRLGLGFDKKKFNEYGLLVKIPVNFNVIH